MARSDALVYALIVSLAAHVVALSLPLRRGDMVGVSRYPALTVSLAVSVVPPKQELEPKVMSFAAAAPASTLPHEIGTRRTEEQAVLDLPLPSVPELPQPLYFTLAELHQHPLPIGRVLIEEEGRVYADSVTILAVFINVVGTVDRVDILSTDNPDLASEFVEKFRRTRYVPGRISGRDVNSELRVEVRSTSMVVQMRTPITH